MTEFWQAFDIRYLLIPLLGGVGVAAIAGPLGSIMVWRRLAYFGDTLSHSGLLGITLALALHINITFGVCFIALIVALLMLKLQSHINVSNDTLLGILSHTTLALGLLVLALMEDIRVDVLGFLYGDILAMTWRDVILVYVGGACAFALLARLWQSLLRITVDTDLAKVEGVPVERIQTVYMLLLAIVIAIAIKIVGVLLITALLVIPAAAARPCAKSPESMALISSVIGTISVICGIGISHIWDVPTGPAIVVFAAAILLLNTMISKYKPAN